MPGWTVEVYNFLGPTDKALVRAEWNPPGPGPERFTKTSVMDSSDPGDQTAFVAQAVAEAQSWNLQRVNDEADAQIIKNLLDAAL